MHILSASCAGFAASTATNPIWFVKTRLQLDHNSKNRMTVRECVAKIYRTSGIAGFYKGITASYVGISETVIHFVIYEAIKSKIVSWWELWCGRLTDFEVDGIIIDFFGIISDGIQTNTTKWKSVFSWFLRIYGGWRCVENSCIMRCLSARSGANAFTWRGQQISNILADFSDCVARGGKSWLVQVRFTSHYGNFDCKLMCFLFSSHTEVLLHN